MSGFESLRYISTGSRVHIEHVPRRHRRDRRPLRPEQQRVRCYIYSSVARACRGRVFHRVGRTRVRVVARVRAQRLRAPGVIAPVAVYAVVVMMRVTAVTMLGGRKGGEPRCVPRECEVAVRAERLVAAAPPVP